MAPWPSSSELTGEVVAVTKEVTASAWEGLVVLVVVMQGCARSLGVSGSLERPLGMLAGSGLWGCWLAAAWRRRARGRRGDPGC